MARPRKYSTGEELRQANARRQAELRDRSLRVERAVAVELVEAVYAAAAAGDALANKVLTGDLDGLLRNLARHFRQAVQDGPR